MSVGVTPPSAPSLWCCESSPTSTRRRIVDAATASITIGSPRAAGVRDRVAHLRRLLDPRTLVGGGAALAAGRARDEPRALDAGTACPGILPRVRVHARLLAVAAAGGLCGARPRAEQPAQLPHGVREQGGRVGVGGVAPAWPPAAQALLEPSHVGPGMRS